MKTYDLIECADLLKVDRNTIMKLAGMGELPGAKIGRAWVFLEDDVLTFLRKKVQEQSLARLQGAHEPETDARVAKAVESNFQLRTGGVRDGVPGRYLTSILLQHELHCTSECARRLLLVGRPESKAAAITRSENYR